MATFENVEYMWFGTEARMSWVETPQTGAEVGSIGMGAEGVLLNGGGFARNSWASHKRYEFSWGDSADLRLASKIQGYASGTFGRGLIYFHDPMYYETNLLPKFWADPSMAVGFEAPSIVRNVDPTGSPLAANANDYPALSATYVLPSGYNSQTAGLELFIPIPPDMALVVGASYSGTPNVYVRSGAGTVNLPRLTLGGNVTSTVVVGQPWARLGFSGTGALTLNGMTARLIPALQAGAVPVEITQGPWMSGEGNTGCRFNGKPTLVNYNGVLGGQVGLAASLIETGAWED